MQNLHRSAARCTQDEERSRAQCGHRGGHKESRQHDGHGKWSQTHTLLPLHRAVPAPNHNSARAHPPWSRPRHKIYQLRLNAACHEYSLQYLQASQVIASKRLISERKSRACAGVGRARSANMTRQVADSFKHPTRAEMFEAPEAQGAGCRVQARTRTRGVQARARACVLCRGQACSRAYLHVVFAYPV